MSTSRPPYFDVGGLALGRGRAFIIAEVGVNHNGDLALAHRLIDAAAGSGVDAIKFQTFVPELLASPSAERADYQRRATGSDASQLEMLRSLELPRAGYPELKRHASERGLLFMSTPFDSDSASFLAEVGVPAWKVSSGDLTNLPFLEELARFGLPMLVSTGMGNLSEVRDALKAIASVEQGLPVALLHCVSAYPTNAEDCNLRAVDTMRARFGCPTGWSDHTVGVAIAIGAAARGADLLEKHVTLDRGMPGPDHAASILPGELRELVRGVREVQQALGDGVKEPRPHERAMALLARKGLVTIAPVRRGELLTRCNVDVRRPASGLAPALFERVLGAVASRDLPQGIPLTGDDVEGLGP